MLPILENEQEQWEVTTDREAEWVIEKYNEKVVEIERYKDSLKDKIELLQEKLKKAEEELQRETEWRDMHLAKYFEKTDPALRRKTKTMEKYRLPSGEIIKKFPNPQLVRSNDLLLGWLKKSNNEKFVAVKESPMWAELKKETKLSGNKVVFTGTGEIIEGVEVVQLAPTIEFKGDK